MQLGIWNNRYLLEASLLILLQLLIHPISGQQMDPCRVYSATVEPDQSQIRSASYWDQWYSTASRAEWTLQDQLLTSPASNRLGRYQRSTTLVTSGFGFRIPQGAIIEEVLITVKGRAIGEGMASTAQLRLTNDYENYLTGNLRSTERPRGAGWRSSTPQNWTYRFYNDGSLTSEIINSSDFGVAMQVLNRRAEAVEVDVDDISIQINYSPLYSTCTDETLTFFTFGGSDVRSYAWDIPEGFRNISALFYPNVIDIERTYAEDGVYEICVDQLMVDGTTKRCCLDFLAEECGSSSIGDQVFLDQDGNGQRDASDQPITDQVVFLRDAAGVKLAETITDQNGRYLFDDLVSGAYYIEFASNGALVPSKPGSDNAITGAFGPRTTDLITLPSDNNFLRADAAFTEPVTIGGFVFEDVNGDGQQEVSDLGLADVPVAIHTLAGETVDSTITDTEGMYLFSGVLPGTYSVAVYTPDDYFPTLADAGPEALDSDLGTDKTIGPFTTLSGAQLTSQDAGVFRLASISGTVFYDVNNSAVQDHGDERLPGIMVRLFRGLSFVDSTITDVNGEYQFNDLSPGQYLVKVSAPEGFVVSEANLGQDDTIDNDFLEVNQRIQSDTIRLLSGGSRIYLDAGLSDLPVLTGRIFVDRNCDGVRDSLEVFDLPSVTVRLMDTTSTEVLSTTTDSAGFFAFRGFDLGRYHLQFDPGLTYGFSAADAAVDSLDSDVTGSNGLGSTEWFLIDELTVYSGLDAGLSPYGTIGDFVWLDSNGSGSQDSTDLPLGDVVIYLQDSTGMPIDTTISDQNGFFGFGQLLKGVYQVAVDLPEGLTITFRGGSNDMDSDLISVTGGQASTFQFDLAPGQHMDTIDLGFRLLPSYLTGIAWMDSDYDGRYSNGETLLESIDVSLYDDQGALVETTTTGQEGVFEFDDLVAGDYYVLFAPVTRTGFTLVGAGPAQFDSDVTGANGVGSTDYVTLTAGDTLSGINAGYAAFSAIGDFVFEDSNANGLQDPSEAGVEGVRLYLMDTTETVLMSTSTDYTGFYQFDSVYGGPYILLADIPQGLEVTVADAANDLLDSDFDQDGRLAIVVPPTGQTNSSYDLGLVNYASIGNYVWMDLNDSGLQDSSDGPLAGVTIFLIDEFSELVDSTESDLDGSFLFDRVLEGTYQLAAVMPTDTELAAMVNNPELDSDLSFIDNGLAFTSPFFVGGGNTVDTVDLGFRPIQKTGGTILGLAWRDTLYDGVFFGEPTLRGVDVQLYTVDRDFVAQTVTDDAGRYQFEQVESGDYFVVFGDVPDHTFTLPNQSLSDTLDSDVDQTFDLGSTGMISVRNDSIIADVDAGYTGLTTLGNLVFWDQDNSFDFSPGDSGVPGITVQLADSQGGILATAVTDSSGSYTFDSLLQGTYQLIFEIPPRYATPVQKDTVSRLNPQLPSQVILPAFASGSGIDMLHLDIGLVTLSSVGDYVYRDIDNNGRQSIVDAGVPDQQVYLIYNGEYIDTTQSDDRGLYWFDSVFPDDYQVGIEIAQGYGVALTDDTASSGSDNDLRIENGKGVTDVFTVPAGVTIDSIDLGLRSLESSLEGIAWSDENGDGIRQSGEPPVSSVFIRLINEMGLIQQIFVTATDGRYRFDNVAPGRYYLIFGLSENRIYTIADVGTDTLDSDVTGAYLLGSTDLIVVPPDTVLSHIDVGYTTVANISGVIWEDLNYNGIHDPGEHGLEQVKVSAVRGLSLIEEMTSRSNGEYTFDSLSLGEYTISIDMPSGYEVTLQDQTFDRVDSDADPDGTVVILTRKSLHDDVDFGLFRRASLSGHVYEDLNYDLAYQDQDGPIQDKMVFLWSQDVLVDSVLTDGNGHFVFDSLLPGSYQIQVDIPSGYHPVWSPVTANQDSVDLNTTVDDYWTRPLDLVSGQLMQNVDVGFVDTVVCIAGLAFIDNDGSGAFDPAVDSPLPGVEGQLLTADHGLVDRLVTSSSGQYALDSVPPGIYYVLFSHIDSLLFTAKSSGTDTIHNDVVIQVSSGGRTADFRVYAREDHYPINAGYTPPSSIGGVVFFDDIADGVQNDGDYPVDGIKVALLDVLGDTINTTVTAQDGQYSFERLVNGQYLVAFDVPDEYKVSPAGMTSDLLDSDVTSSVFLHATDILTLTPGTVLSSIDMGISLRQGLNLNIWHDKDADGEFDPEEEGLDSVQVTLVNRAEDIQISKLTSKTSGRPHHVFFDELPFDTYRLIVKATPGWVASRSEEQHSFYERNGSIVTDWISVDQSTLSTTLDLGLHIGGTIQTRVWVDQNNDGQCQANEPGKRSVYATLVDVETRQQRTKITNADGFAEWTDLQRGQYFINYFSTEGLSFTQADQGSDLSDSDVSGENGRGTTKVYMIPHNFTTTHISAGLAVDQSLEKVERVEFTQLTSRSVEDSEVRLYPNPAQNFITVSSAGAKELAFTIYTADGQVVKEGVSASGELLDISDLEAGIYSVDVEVAGEHSTHLIIKIE